MEKQVHRNYPELSRWLVTKVCGHKSQTQINRSFGCNYNKVFQWESGRVQINWGDFVRLCQIVHIPLASKLELASGYRGDPTQSAELISYLLDKTSNQSASRQLEITGHLVSDLKQGVSTLKLIHVLGALDIHSKSTERFINSLLTSPKDQTQGTAQPNRRRAVFFVHRENFDRVCQLYEQFVDELQNYNSVTGKDKIVIDFQRLKTLTKTTSLEDN